MAGTEPLAAEAATEPPRVARVERPRFRGQIKTNTNTSTTSKPPADLPPSERKETQIENDVTPKVSATEIVPER
jgi:hypothetical protein